MTQVPLTQLHNNDPAGLALAESIANQARNAKPACPLAAARYYLELSGKLTKDFPPFPCKGIRNDENFRRANELIDGKNIPDGIKDDLRGCLDTFPEVLESLIYSLAMEITWRRDAQRRLDELAEERIPGV